MVCVPLKFSPSKGVTVLLKDNFPKDYSGFVIDPVLK